MATNTNLTLCVPRPSAPTSGTGPTLAYSLAPDASQCPPNHVIIKVDRFGFSANNITYQALGEHSHFRYFDFHEVPETPNTSGNTHGLIPVWGYGTVVKSTHPKIQDGERVYGYLAPARYLLLPVSPRDVNRHAFYVPRPHLPEDRRPYNQLIRCNADPQYSPDTVIEDLTMLYRPLFWTSYWCEDWLATSKYRHGASTILISSASSKTAFCLAYLIKKRISRGEAAKSTKVIGLTSKGNVTFTKQLGLYDEVLEYNTFTESQSLNGRRTERWIYVDVAGNANLNQRVTAHFASPYAPQLAACVSLGLTNLSPTSGEADSIQWKPNPFSTDTNAQELTTSSFWPVFEDFFMPEWLNIRKYQLSIPEITSRQNEAWKQLMMDCRKWVELVHIEGGEAVKKDYEFIAEKGLGPDKGRIWSLWDRPTILSKL